MTNLTRPMARRIAGPVLIAMAATAATLVTLGPGEGGPGVTCDEAYHVAYGKGLVAALRHQGLSFFAPRNIQQNFRWTPHGPPVHPPLANFILGWTHHLFDPDPDEPMVVSIAAARFAPAVAFGLLALLVGVSTVRMEGPLAGAVAAAAVVLVPRMFAHGHLAALDTITALFFVAAVLAVIEADARRGGGVWHPHMPPSATGRLWHFGLAGVAWGLAILTRLHGLLLLPPVVAWLAWRLGRRAVWPLIVWGGVGMATFFAGWPWLWLAPVAHFRQFLGTAAGRQAVHVFYAGRTWDDYRAPWHYPIVMFVVALPLGLFLLGLLGAWARRARGAGVTPVAPADPGYWLVMGTLAFILLVFAWPGVPVYDGVRLFLMVFPLWAVSVGAGARWVADHPLWRHTSLQLRLVALGLFLAMQGVGLVLYHPCQLSHYSLLVGGLPGAEQLGFEVTYWGDAVQESLLAEAVQRAPGEPILFGPSLASFQVDGIWLNSPALREKARMEGHVPLVGWNRSRPELADGCRYAVFYNRKADLDQIPPDLLASQLLVNYEKQGVWLARLVRFRKPLVRGSRPQ